MVSITILGTSIIAEAKENYEATSRVYAGTVYAQKERKSSQGPAETTGTASLELKLGSTGKLLTPTTETLVNFEGEGVKSIRGPVLKKAGSLLTSHQRKEQITRYSLSLLAENSAWLDGVPDISLMRNDFSKSVETHQLRYTPQVSIIRSLSPVQEVGISAQKTYRYHYSPGEKQQAVASYGIETSPTRKSEFQLRLASNQSSKTTHLVELSANEIFKYSPIVRVKCSLGSGVLWQDASNKNQVFSLNCNLKQNQKSSATELEAGRQVTDDADTGDFVLIDKVHAGKSEFIDINRKLSANATYSVTRNLASSSSQGSRHFDTTITHEWFLMAPAIRRISVQPITALISATLARDTSAITTHSTLLRLGILCEI